MAETQPKLIINRRDKLSPQQRAVREQYPEDDIPDDLRIPETPADGESFVEQFGYVEFDPRYQIVREREAVRLLQLPISEFAEPDMRTAQERFAQLFPNGAFVDSDGYIATDQGVRYLASALLPNSRSLDERARREFQSQHGEDSLQYFHAEAVRVYENLTNDPVVLNFINSHTGEVEREIRYRGQFGRTVTSEQRLQMLRDAMSEKIREWTSGKLEKTQGYAEMQSSDSVVQIFIQLLRQDLVERSEFAGEQQWVMEAPRAIDMYGDVDRTNIIRSEFVENTPRRYQVHEREFTEIEGLQDLISFLDAVERKATEVDNTELSATAAAMRENFRFIGDKEFNEATTVIAQRMVEKIREGKQVYVNIIKQRSERYTCLRILEAFSALTEQEPSLRESVKLGGQHDIAQVAKDDIANSHIVVADDFAVSGNRINGGTYRMMEYLHAEGISYNDALRAIEATIIAMPVSLYESRLTVRDQPYNLFSVYGVPEYRKPDGGLYVFTGVSMSGAHCSVDYGFECDLDQMSTFMRDQGEPVTTPLLTHIDRPYKSKATTTEHFADPNLQDRWNVAIEQYGLETFKYNKRRMDEVIAQREAREAREAVSVA